MPLNDKNYAGLTKHKASGSNAVLQSAAVTSHKQIPSASAEPKPKSPCPEEHLKLNNQPVSFNTATSRITVAASKNQSEIAVDKSAFVLNQPFHSPVKTNRHYAHLQSNSTEKDVIGSPYPNNGFLSQTMNQHHNWKIHESPFKKHDTKYQSPYHRLRTQTDMEKMSDENVRFSSEKTLRNNSGPYTFQCSNGSRIISNTNIFK